MGRHGVVHGHPVTVHPRCCTIWHELQAMTAMSPKNCKCAKSFESGQKKVGANSFRAKAPNIKTPQFSPPWLISKVLANTPQLLAVSATPYSFWQGFQSSRACDFKGVSPLLSPALCLGGHFTELAHLSQISATWTTPNSSALSSLYWSNVSA